MPLMGLEIVCVGVRKILDIVKPEENPSSHVPTPPDAIALEAQVALLRKMLLSEDNDNRYIAILGMGGIGKTTLAKAIINDVEIKEKFPIRGFVIVARCPDIVQRQKEIWEAIVSSKDKGEFANAEIGKLRLQSALKDKCVLLVVDDVWDKEDMNDLDVVSENSRVLITSRNEEVASHIHARCHNVVGLDDVQSMDLFCKHAFQGGRPSKWQQGFVDDIVQECAGIPLALVVMGHEVGSYSRPGHVSVSLSPEEEDRWQNAVASIKERGVVGKTVFDRVFCLSFKSLDIPHQQIMLDLAMLPEDYHIRRSDVVDLLISNGSCADEFRARHILRDLENRSLILRTGECVTRVFEFQSLGAVHYHLHDVIRDCALEHIANSPLCERARLVSSQLKTAIHTDCRLSATRFSSSQRIRNDQPWRLQDLYMPQLKILQLRDSEILELPASLLVTQLVSIDMSSSRITQLPSEISSLECVKVLRVDHCNRLSCLPNELGNMEQLMVLSLRKCRSIYKIPESVTRLVNLTKLLIPFCGIAHFLQPKPEGLQNLSKLDLSKCFGLKELPTTFGDLANLTALNLGGCWQLASLPSSIHQLAKLQWLLLNGCSSLTMIPSSITCLHKLEELDAQDCSSLTSLPDGLDEGCPNLRTLRFQGDFELAFPKMVNELKKLQVLGLPSIENGVLGEGQMEISVSGTKYTLPEGWSLSDAILNDVLIEPIRTKECVFNKQEVSWTCQL